MAWALSALYQERKQSWVENLIFTGHFPCTVPCSPLRLGKAGKLAMGHKSRGLEGQGFHPGEPLTTADAGSRVWQSWLHKWPGPVNFKIPRQSPVTEGSLCRTGELPRDMGGTRKTRSRRHSWLFTPSVLGLPDPWCTSILLFVSSFLSLAQVCTAELILPLPFTLHFQINFPHHFWLVSSSSLFGEPFLEELPENTVTALT